MKNTANFVVMLAKLSAQSGHQKLIPIAIEARMLILMSNVEVNCAAALIVFILPHGLDSALEDVIADFGCNYKIHQLNCNSIWKSYVARGLEG